MKRIISYSVASLLVVACAAPPETERKLAPPMVLKRVDSGDSYSLAAQKGKVVLVDLWATWCGPCLAELPHLQKLSDAFSPQDFQMVGVVIESGDATEVRDFIREKGVSYVNLLGEDGTKSSFGPFLAYPTKYLVDKDGYVVQKYIGLVGERLNEDVQALVRTGALPKKTASGGGGN